MGEHSGPEGPVWYVDYGNIVLLTSWLAERGWDAATVAYAVEKPWKYEDEFAAALKADR